MIRQATAADTGSIARLIRGLAQYEKLEHAVSLDEDRLRAHLFGPTPHARVLLAEEAGRIVGFALFFTTYSTFLAKPGLWLEDLFVLPEARGQGHGKALLAAVARIACDLDCGRLEWSVLDWNEPAIQFYRALGAGPLDDWTQFRLTGNALQALAGHANAQEAT
ncbi:MAG: N-acetyltransferase family protein [Gemmataceae bacterium]